MMECSAPLFTRSRLAAVIAAAGLLFVPMASAQTALPPPSFGQADTRQDRIESLESQLRDATAENERLQYELMQAQREIQRLRNMVGELAGVNQDLATPPPEESADETAPPPGGGDMADARARATGTLGTLPASQVPARVDPADAYSRARELLVAGQLAEAEVAFQDFLQTYSDSSNAIDARFWLAYTLLARNNYQDAAANFVTYLQDAPRGPRAPEAQVRLGMALAGMGQTRQACGAFSSLGRSYPNAPRNVRDLAAREARASNC